MTTLMNHSPAMLWNRFEEEAPPVRYTFGTVRAARPADTLRRIFPMLKPAGITRLADITSLYWVGVPVYQAVRPNSRNFSVSQGKGLTRDQAKVSALMEALEFFHAERIFQPSVRESIKAMQCLLPYDPDALSLTEPSRYSRDYVAEWVSATDLVTGQPTWVPKQLCELDDSIEIRREPTVFEPSSNGLASGNTVAEALLHGLCEVVERDSSWRASHFDCVHDRKVAVSSIRSRLAQRVLSKLARAGMAVEIVDTSGPTSMPAFEVTLWDPDMGNLYLGAGCHLKRTTALLRALTEAIQSRLTDVAGTRDDIRRSEYGGGRVPTGPPPAFGVTGTRKFDQVPTHRVADLVTMAKDVAGRIRELTGMPPLAVDLTRPDFGIPVSFVVAPGLRMLGY